MIKATNESITSAKTRNASLSGKDWVDAPLAGGCINLAPERVEYIAADKVLVSLKTKAGDIVTYTMSSAALVQSVNLSVALINSSPARIFRDLGVF